MPVINGIKFSCSPCVKGHRSANCIHEDRPLLEIKSTSLRPRSLALLTRSREGSATDAVRWLSRAP